MIPAVFWYDLRHWLRQPVFYLYFSVFLILSFLLFMGDAGFFDRRSVLSTPVEYVNAPIRILRFIQYLLKPLLFILPALLGANIYRDFQHRMFSILYSYPIKERPYLTSKLTSGIILVIIVASGIFLALIVGEFLLKLMDGAVSSYSFMHFFKVYALYLIPNLLIFGIPVFAVVALSRNIFAGFWLVILLLSFSEAAKNLPPGSLYLQALLDPLGDHALTQPTLNWNMALINQAPIPITRLFIINRLAWLAISLMVWLFLGNTFKFRQQAALVIPPIFKNKGRKGIRPFSGDDRAPKLSFTGLHHLRTLITLSHLSRSLILRHWLLPAFSVALILILLLALIKVVYGGPVTWQPLTRMVIYLPAFVSTQLIALFTFISAAIISSHGQDPRIGALIGPLPVKTWVFPIADFLAIFQMQFLLLGLFILVSVSFQLLSGYQHADLKSYLLHILTYMLPHLLVWNITSLFLMALVGRIYPGLFLLLLVWLGTLSFDSLGLQSLLLRFNEPEIAVHSAFNAYGPLFYGALLKRLYWLLCAAVLLILSVLIWRRELSRVINDKWRQIKSRFSSGLGTILIVCLVSFILVGLKIYEEQAREYSPLPENANREELLDPYRDLIHLPQPRITDVNLQVDIYPEQHRFKAMGTYRIKNLSSAAIDTLILRKSFDEQTQIRIGRYTEKLVSDSLLRMEIHHLKKALMPGDSMSISFAIQSTANTAFQRNTNVFNNGSLVHDDFLPRLGLPRIGAAVTDLKSHSRNHYQSTDSDRLTFEALVSTSDGQVAFSVGELLASRQDSNRRYFRYRSIEPIKFNFFFASGNYQLSEASQGNQQLKIYHHADHVQVIPSLKSGWKAAVRLNQKIFGLEPAANWNMIEYPVQLGSANTLICRSLLLSEELFAVDPLAENQIDFPFYIAAHECTHHWFGNRLMPAAGNGATMLTESLTEYLSLHAYEQKYGPTAALQLLKMQHQRYFRGRTNNEHEETLAEVMPVSEYLAYGKGAIAFNAIANVWGKAEFHKFLAGFFDTYADLAVYPGSDTFLDQLRTALPDSLHYLERELFRSSCIHDLQVEDCRVFERPGGGFEISVRISDAHKSSNHCPEPGRLTLRIQLLDREGIEISSQTVHPSAKSTVFRISCSKKPETLILDPNYLILDPQRENNQIMVSP